MADVDFDVDTAATDQELIDFFSAFDEVKASDELKDATIAAIFATMDAGDKTAILEGADGAEVAAAATAPARGDAAAATTASTAPQLSLVDMGDVTHEAAVAPAGDGASTGPVARRTDAHTGPTLSLVDDEVTTTAPADDASVTRASTPRLTAVDGGGEKARASHAPSRPLRMRIAAAIVAIALVGTAGGVAYAVPASRVQVTEGGTTVEMGVNVFGVTVAASATTEEGKAILAEVDIHDKGFDDALATVIDRMAARGEGDGSVRIEVDGGFGGERLESGAARVINDRGLERGDGARGPKGAESPGTTESATSGAAPGTASRATGGLGEAARGVGGTAGGGAGGAASGRPTVAQPGTTGTSAADQGTAEPSEGARGTGANTDVTRGDAASRSGIGAGETDVRGQGKDVSTSMTDAARTRTPTRDDDGAAAAMGAQSDDGRGAANGAGDREAGRGGVSLTEGAAGGALSAQSDAAGSSDDDNGARSSEAPARERCVPAPTDAAAKTPHALQAS